ncbi:MAG: hypothetical protein ACFFA0_04260 [Promethearchaeota archaeon]
MMLKKERFLFTFVICLIFLISTSYLPKESNYEHHIQNDQIYPRTSASLEGAENIIVTDVLRIVNISGYGVVYFEDIISIKNLNSNPISSMFIGILLNSSENLLYFEAKGNNDNTLLAERSYMVMNGFEMIAIYFDSPLLPHQTKTIKFIQYFNNFMAYYLDYPGGGEYRQYHTFHGYVYPTLPYKSERSMSTVVNIPKDSDNIDGGWGFVASDLHFIKYDFFLIESFVEEPYIEPFLENLNNYKAIDIAFSLNEITMMEFEEINREIYISPWGIIRISEEFTIKNYGIIPMNLIYLKLPINAKELYVSDDIGQILGISNNAKSYYREIKIDLFENRVRLLPDSSFRFRIKYYLPFEKHFSIDWFQESIKIDLYSTSFEYLGKQQTIRLVIDGCYSLDYITELPEAIEKSQGSMTLYFTSESVCPIESKIIQFTFTIDIIDLLFKPILYMLTISIIASIYVFLVKTRKKEYDTLILKREFIPVNEIREFCALYEEKNALILELRQAEEDAKRKKIAKKNYKNILNKNTAKVDEIQQEIAPFKKILLESGETFENIVKRLDVLDAERISIKDSLNLLESRYKRGRLPSRAAYMKLSDDFKKRRKKIDRTIDRFLQQLRSYLL